MNKAITDNIASDNFFSKLFYITGNNAWFGVRDPFYTMQIALSSTAKADPHLQVFYFFTNRVRQTCVIFS